MGIIGNTIFFSGSGGGGDVYAFIVCTYPSGYSCTASNGVNTLSAPDTSGFVVFRIPTPLSVPETWTIISTNGIDSDSQTVSITSKGQSVSVFMFVPEGYTKLDYVQKTGTQYINTGYTATGTTRLKGRFKFPTDASTLVLFGSNTSSASNAYELYVDSSGGLHLTDFVEIYANSSFKHTGIEHQVGIWFTVDMNRGALTITHDGGQEESYSIASASFTANNSLYLGELPRASTFSFTMQMGIIEIYNNGVIQRKMIPARRTSDSKNGLYDTVTGTFYLANSGDLGGG